ncbi:DNA primase [Candidatus Curtissbacteria bacterium RBG_16_39_7]|uniref:DNA primase n=1 Tax=Candidatus Curtissbacteria bacterium RBG_16_39_7 TaxID=1797707 RepID=A0A1F5G422_9BACT|nr:MAG: DNA primase [Candidatus Curtissbacteria bacterium RBG_16_39_7]
MTDSIEEIKRKIDIVEFISEYLPLKKMGRNFAAKCPFHQETKPSFMISPDRQIFRCFGCEAAGDIFAFLEKKEGLSFPEALEVLAKRAGVTLERFEPRKKSEREKLLTITNWATKLFHHLLTKHGLGKRARAYLEKRGINEKSVVDFGLGYAPKSGELLSKFLESKSFQQADVASSGLLVSRARGGYFDRFRDRIIFPIKDVKGQVAGFSGRLIELGGEKFPETEPKYLNSPETPIFQKGFLLYGLDLAKEAIREKKIAVLVEGEFDVISSHQAQVKNVVAVKGTSLTREQIGLVSRFAENIAICFDTDIAGDAAARRGIELAEQAGMNIKVIQTAGFKDPDEMIKSSAQKWQDAVEKAVPVYDWLIDSALHRFDKTTAEGKKKIGQELLPIFSRISDDLVKAHYLQKLAAKLSLAEEVLWKALTKTSIKNLVFEEVLVEKDKRSDFKRDKLSFLCERFLALLLQGWEFCDRRDFWPQPSDFSPGPLKKIFENIIISPLAKGPKEKKEFELGQFSKALPEDIIPLVDRLILTDLGDVLEDKDKFQAELQKRSKEIREQGLKKELTRLSLAIRESEKEKNKEKLSLLQKEFGQILEELGKISRS